MTTATETRTIQFPPLDETSAAHILQLVDTMKDFMEIEIYPKEVTIKVLTFELPADCFGAITILNKLAESKKKERVFKHPKNSERIST